MKQVILVLFEHNVEKEQLAENPELLYCIAQYSHYSLFVWTLQGQQQPWLFSGRKQKVINATQIYIGFTFLTFLAICVNYIDGLTTS